MPVSQLGRIARKLAAIAHEGQMYGKRPYLLHVMRVARQVRALAPRDAVLEAAAYLHDVLEDTDLSPLIIESWCGGEVLQVIQVLTRAHGEQYSDYIARVSHSPRAAIIKVADLGDHLAQTEPKGTLTKRYQRAKVQLSAVREEKGGGNVQEG